MGKIQLKYGSQSAVPSGLLDGEFAINLDTHQLWYGSGSAVLSDIRFDKITAEQYVISSSVTHMTTSFSSGSTEFGDTVDDTHTFTGNITASGDISASGEIKANTLDIASTSNFADDITLGDAKKLKGARIVISASNNNIYGTSIFHQNVDLNGDVDIDGTTTLNGDLVFSANQDIYAADDFLLRSSNQSTTFFKLVGDDGFQINANGIQVANFTSAGVKINELGASSCDFRIEGDTDTHLFFTDAGADKVAIGTDTVGNSLLTIDGDATLTNVTASGNISASGTIYTDNLSSPGNDLTVASTTVTITAGTAGDANLILQADTDNNDEADNPFMLFEQDGGAIRSIIGHTGANTQWPDATPLAGGLSNNLVIGTTGSAGYGRGMQFAVLNTVAMTISASGAVGIGTTSPTELLTVVGNIKARGRRFDPPSHVAGTSEGDVVYFGSTTSMVAGSIYHYNSSGAWELADADDNTKSDGLLGVAIGAASDLDGVLLRGMVSLGHDAGAIGDPLYLTTNAGSGSATAPSGNGNIVRVIGYKIYHSTQGQIWFNPDNTFVEVNA